MKHDEFIAQVCERTGLDRTGGEQAAQATLTTLAERITKEEAGHLASQLPQELQPPLESPGGTGEPFGPDEFLRRVGEREGVAPATAEEHARAVLATVRDAVTSGQLDDVLSQLPEGYRELFSSP